MAHGYISSNGILEEEDIANEIWNELVLRSMFQDVREYGRGRTTFTMHDLVHDLAQSVMENKVPGVQGQVNDHKSASKGKIRQVNLGNHHVAFPSSTRVEIDLSFCLMNLNGLRTLDASNTRIDNMPSTIGNLKHLRHLNLSYSVIRTLPNAICSLWNLKILNLNFCYHLVGLPEQTRFLRNLRHLLLENCWSLDEMPPKIGELSDSLKTLSRFVVGSGKGNRLGELQLLNIGGKLEIRHLERVEKHEDAKMANLHEKKNLRELRLSWEDDTFGMEKMDEKVLEALEPHPNMEAIKIYGFRGRYFPQWWRINSSLVNLVEFYLLNCPNCLRLPQLGKLPHLKIMDLRDVGVEYIVEDGSSTIIFPSLEQLSLDGLRRLKALSKEKVTEIFPRLQKLDIQDLTGYPHGWSPHLTSLKELTISSFRIFVELPEDTRYLKSLTKIRLYDLPKMVSLPEALKHLPSPFSLCLEKLPELTTMAACSTSLTDLNICNCPKLTSLPDTIKEMEHLKFLNISQCPELEWRCEKEKGEDWHKIDHIPHVWIGDRWALWLTRAVSSSQH